MLLADTGPVVPNLELQTCLEWAIAPLALARNSDGAPVSVFDQLRRTYRTSLGTAVHLNDTNTYSWLP